MIVTVTLNASWDITYRIPALRPGEAHRVSEIDERAGGKGLNVARTLQALTEPLLVTGLTGGQTGARIRADLVAAGVPAVMVDSGCENRRTVTVVAEGLATLLSEPGPAELNWSELRVATSRNFAGADVVVLAGSVPPGLSASVYRDLVEDAHATGAKVILDCDGEPFSLALEAKPDLVKPNASELAAVTGTTDPVAGAIELVERGARCVVVSLGTDGMIAFDGLTGWRIDAVPLIPINPTGAGDAAVAGLARGLAHDHAIAQLLADATALAARAVRAAAAGDLSPEPMRPKPAFPIYPGGTHA